MGVEGIFYNMNQKNKPSLLYWGKKLINFTIFVEKIVYLKTVIKLFYLEIRDFNPIFSLFGGLIHVFLY